MAMMIRLGADSLACLFPESSRSPGPRVLRRNLTAPRAQPAAQICVAREPRHQVGQRLSIVWVEQLGAAAQEIYEQANFSENFTAHSRTDVPTWREIER